MEQVAFYILSSIIIISSLFMITRKNPVHSILWMLLTFFSAAGIFIQLNADFIAAIQVIVYAGAILVLFLFVVMLLNPKTHGFVAVPFRNIIGVVVVFVVVLEILMALGSMSIHGKYGNITPEKLEALGSVKLFGTELFTNYLVPFEIASILLLIAMIGAIVLAMKK